MLAAWLLVSFVLVPLQTRSGEPFEWMEGISIWPTEIIRILAIVLALFYFWSTHRVLEKNKDEIEREFGLAPAGRPRESQRVIFPIG